MDRRLHSVKCTSGNKRTNRDNQQFIAGSQNRYAGQLARRSKGGNVAAPKLSGCAAIFLLSSIVPGHAQTLDPKADPEPTAATIRPFKMHVPDQLFGVEVFQTRGLFASVTLLRSNPRIRRVPAEFGHSGNIT